MEGTSLFLGDRTCDDVSFDEMILSSSKKRDQNVRLASSEEICGGVRFQYFTTGRLAMNVGFSTL